jgi:hypothetical protein
MMLNASNLDHPPAQDVTWRVWIKATPTAETSVQARTWFSARELGALFENVDASIATELA